MKNERLEAARIVLAALLALPSQEIYPSTYVNYNITGIKPGDCRYCVKGAAAAYLGAYKSIVQNGHRPGPYDIPATKVLQQIGSNGYGVLTKIECHAINLRDRYYRSFTINAYNSKNVRHRIWKGCVAYTRKLIKELEAK